MFLALNLVATEKVSSAYDRSRRRPDSDPEIPVEHLCMRRTGRRGSRHTQSSACIWVPAVCEHVHRMRMHGCMKRLTETCTCIVAGVLGGHGALSVFPCAVKCETCVRRAERKSGISLNVDHITLRIVHHTIVSCNECREYRAGRCCGRYDQPNARKQCSSSACDMPASVRKMAQTTAIIGAYWHRSCTEIEKNEKLTHRDGL